jgi:ATP-dependent DNA helicase RecG
VLNAARDRGAAAPHLLSMTATPIPRTLALVRHGNMSLSAIGEAPPGRTPVATAVLPSDDPAARQQVCAARPGRCASPACLARVLFCGSRASTRFHPHPAPFRQTTL